MGYFFVKDGMVIESISQEQSNALLNNGFTRISQAMITDEHTVKTYDAYVAKLYQQEAVWTPEFKQKWPF